MTNRTDLELFAITAPGLEALCADELNQLGFAATAMEGGAGWTGDLRSLYRSNLELRTASRVIARLGSFRARTFHELERHIARLPWSRFVARGRPVLLRVTARKSKLYHEGAVAERIARWLHVELEVEVGRASNAEVEAEAQLIIVRLLRDVCTVSADSSGALLHQRGYRQALAKAPLRETIAAALLRLSGWTPDRPLIDPLCGSGTIPIEAALIARRIAPGLASPDHAPRRYQFETWPDWDPDLWHDVVADARRIILPPGVTTITGCDRNAGAIRAASSNAERAGVRDDAQLETRPLASFTAASGAGCVVTNPPYGVRVGERAELGQLYAELGRVLWNRAPGWTVAMLSADPRLDAATRLPLEERARTRNGGIPVRMLVGTIPVDQVDYTATLHHRPSR